MRIEEAVENLYRILPPGALNSVRVLVFQKAWEGKSYEEIALESGYGYDYVRTAGFQLWQALSETLNEKVTKKNFRALLEQRTVTQGNLANIPTVNAGRIPNQPPMPLNGQLPLDSPFYVYRPPTESLCYEAILQPGALVRIKAASQMGKTSLLARVLAQARQHQFHTIILNLQLIDESVLTESSRFLQWFCAVVAQNLQLPNQFETYWNDLFGASYNCTNYFESYLLTRTENPIVLALDRVDLLFERQQIAANFLRMLRAWYEQARYGDERSKLWQKLRLVVVYATEVYLPLNINHSPFNAGVLIELPRFSLEQVQDLAGRYGVDNGGECARQLMELVGGKPYLVQLALFHLQQQDVTLEQLRQTASAANGIYSSHLWHQLGQLQQYPELVAALKQVVLSPTPVALNPILAFKLHSQGLIQLQDNHAVPSCKLYRQYFAQVLATD